MPQMCPMYWLFLFLYFILMLVLLMTFIYFTYFNIYKETKINLLTYKFSWLW
uniref:ATP synthase F0 subunit 8 n=1 Tax=Tettigotoma maculata TaxID=2219950 RepID=A0A3S7MGT3_9HEMI|nr:ATP synthase F0 subunit 8 [Tettigotoma maculata]